MARSWAELLGEPDARPEPEEQRAGMFARLRDSLSKSRRALTGELAAAAFDPGNADDWERLEEALIQGDVGVRATAELVRRLETRGELGDLNEALADEIAALMGEPDVLHVQDRPSVVLVVGVNGTGKTTTIGKLAARLDEHGRSVLVAAADTFRAAAEEQLEIWAQRANADFVGSERGGDPAAVAYDAVEGRAALWVGWHVHQTGDRPSGRDRPRGRRRLHPRRRPAPARAVHPGRDAMAGRGAPQSRLARFSRPVLPARRQPSELVRLTDLRRRQREEHPRGRDGDQT